MHRSSNIRNIFALPQKIATCSKTLMPFRCSVCLCLHKQLQLIHQSLSAHRGHCEFIQLRLVEMSEPILLPLSLQFRPKFRHPQYVAKLPLTLNELIIMFLWVMKKRYGSGLFLKGINLTLFEFLFLSGECSMLLAHSN